MPIYEYQCQSCSAAVEILQKATDPAPQSCETCGKGPMVKQMSLSSFALKGTGWYVTDFRGGNNSSSAVGSQGNSKQDAPSQTASPKPESDKKETNSAGSETTAPTPPASTSGT